MYINSYVCISTTNRSTNERMMRLTPLGLCGCEAARKRSSEVKIVSGKAVYGKKERTKSKPNRGIFSVKVRERLSSRPFPSTD